MANVRFSFCPSCNCDQFVFYDTTGRTPGIPNGYNVPNMSSLIGSLEFFDVNGDIVGTYVIFPQGDATVPTSYNYEADEDNKITDGTYRIVYTVRDNGGTVIGSSEQYVAITCRGECKLEDLLSRFVDAKGKVRGLMIDQINTAAMHMRAAHWLAQLAEQDASQEQVITMHEYLTD